MSNQFNQPENMSRRHFMRQAACAALGATALVNTMASLRLTSAAIAQGADQTDYKALVCIFLAGGNDSNNLIVPLSTGGYESLYDDYVAGRTDQLAIKNGLHSINLGTSQAAFNEYHGGTVPNMGTHPNTPGIATLFNEEDLAFVCNVGTLAAPVPSRQHYLKKSVALPNDLFSHSDQQMQWQTSVADKPISTGWGGRMVDELLKEGERCRDPEVSMNLSFAGTNIFQRGVCPETTAFSVGKSGAKRLNGFGNATDPYGNAYHAGSTFADPNYQDTKAGHRLRAVEKLMGLTSDNLLEETYASRLLNNRDVFDTISEALAEADGKRVNVDGERITIDQVFIDAEAEHDLGDQLKGVAKLIAGRNALGNQRQIFFVSVGGYDIHQNHLESHAELMQELSTGLTAFRTALKGLNEWQNVVAYTASDFNRTFSPNDDSPDSGTDHAWGGHAMVMGGPIKGGKLYGHFPSLNLGNAGDSIDADRDSEQRGRWIPSTSVDQYSAILAKWFGVDGNSMDAIFPNLDRFDDPFSVTAANLNFLEGI